MPPKTPEKLLDRDWVYRVYIEQEMTLDEVAEIANCSRSAVSRALIRFDIPRRKPKSKYPQLNDKEWLIDAYVNQKRSTESIADEVGCHSGLIYDMLSKRLKVKMRSMSEAQRLVDRTRENSANWKGGKYTHVTGYIFVRAPEHHLSHPNGYIAEHRLVMEEKLGRELKLGEVVHHIDGDKQNNDPDNLALMNRAQHVFEHKQILRQMSGLEEQVRILKEKLRAYEHKYGPLQD